MPASRGGPGWQAESDPAATAREVCLRLLSARARTRAELAGALSRRDIADEVATMVLDRFTEVGLLDDAAFAETYVHSARLQRGLGRKALRAELRRRGVSEDLAKDAVSDIDGASEEAAARNLVQQRLRTMSVVEPGAKLRRLVAMLGRKGYPEGLARRVVRDEVAVRVHDPAEVDPGDPE